jgi:histone-lysine N-methyltransferase EZH2
MSHDTSDEEEGESDSLILLSSSSIGDENEKNRALAFRVYEEVWNEFNKWKAEDCKQQLRLLQRPLPPPEVAQAAQRMTSVFRTGGPGDVETIYLCDTEDDIPLDSGGATVLTCNTVPLKLPEKVNEPHPRYEFCTPSVQSISFHVESAAWDELETVPFVPYADDPTFNARGYLRQYAQFAWEYLGDPDGRLFNSFCRHPPLSITLLISSAALATVVEEIQFEVLRRLHLGHGLSLDSIDSLNVLPASRQTNRFGLIYKMTQRCVLRASVFSLLP